METSPPLPPFLIKTYDMVDDSSTDVIVSWSPACRNSFVVWDFYEFSRALLPRFFKHSNFSSFVRQLNTYGFKKADPDRWEFSHDEFVRGQRHRLKNIRRKKPVATAGSSTLAAVVPHVQGGSADVGAHPPLNGWSTPGGHHHQHHHQQSARQAENEVEQLRRERNVIMLELNKLGGQHHSAHQQIKYMSDRLQAMEMRQQQIVAFVARTMCSPHFLYQYVNQAVAVDHSRAQQKALEDCKEDSSSSGTWKRRRITYADCGGGSSTGMIAGCSDYNQLQMQEQFVEEHASSCRMQEQFAEEHASSCKINRGTPTPTPTPTTMSTTSDEQESAASYDQKLMVQLNLESVVNSNLCSDSLIQGGGNHAETHNLACQNRGNNRDVTGVATTTSGGMLEDVKMKMKMKMKRPICEGYALSLEGEDHLQMVDLNLQPFGNMADSFPFLPINSRIGNGDSGSPAVKYMQANASNTYFEDLESELFWEHLLWPVSMQGEFNGTRSAPGFVNCYGLNE